jgi:hypothetical protein
MCPHSTSKNKQDNCFQPDTGICTPYIVGTYDAESGNLTGAECYPNMVDCYYVENPACTGCSEGTSGECQVAFDGAVLSQKICVPSVAIGDPARPTCFTMDCPANSEACEKRVRPTVPELCDASVCRPGTSGGCYDPSTKGEDGLAACEPFTSMSEGWTMPASFDAAPTLRTQKPSAEAKVTDCEQHFDENGDPLLLKYSDARAFCAERGDDLPAIYDAEGNTRVADLITGDLKKVWVGMSDAVSDGTFVTVDDIAFRASAYEGYTLPWAEGEPNGARNENCAAVYKNGAWNDVSCSDFTTGVVCCTPVESGRVAYAGNAECAADLLKCAEVGGECPAGDACRVVPDGPTYVPVQMDFAEAEPVNIVGFGQNAVTAAQANPGLYVGQIDGKHGDDLFIASGEGYKFYLAGANGKDFFDSVSYGNIEADVAAFAVGGEDFTGDADADVLVVTTSGDEAAAFVVAGPGSSNPVMNLTVPTAITSGPSTNLAAVAAGRPGYTDAPVMVAFGTDSDLILAPMNQTDLALGDTVTIPGAVVSLAFVNGVLFVQGGGSVKVLTFNESGAVAVAHTFAATPATADAMRPYPVAGGAAAVAILSDSATSAPNGCSFKYSVLTSDTFCASAVNLELLVYHPDSGGSELPIGAINVDYNSTSGTTTVRAAEFEVSDFLDFQVGHFDDDDCVDIAVVTKQSFTFATTASCASRGYTLLETKEVNPDDEVVLGDDATRTETATSSTASSVTTTTTNTADAGSCLEGVNHTLLAPDAKVLFMAAGYEICANAPLYSVCKNCGTILTTTTTSSTATETTTATEDNATPPKALEDVNCMESSVQLGLQAQFPAIVPRCSAETEGSLIGEVDAASFIGVSHSYSCCDTAPERRHRQRRRLLDADGAAEERISCLDACSLGTSGECRLLHQGNLFCAANLTDGACPELPATAGFGQYSRCAPDTTTSSTSTTSSSTTSSSHSTATVPVDEADCQGCAFGSSGPCHYAALNLCLAYEEPAIRRCPAFADTCQGKEVTTKTKTTNTATTVTITTTSGTSSSASSTSSSTTITNERDSLTGELRYQWCQQCDVSSTTSTGSYTTFTTSSTTGSTTLGEVTSEVGPESSARISTNSGKFAAGPFFRVVTSMAAPDTFTAATPDRVRIAMGDFDGDGDQDLAYVEVQPSAREGSVNWLRNGGDNLAGECAVLSGRKTSFADLCEPVF